VSLQLSRWRSLRLRLPVLMSGLIALVLVAVFWAVNHEIEQMLLRAGSERAQAAADQLGAILAQGAARGTNEMRRIANDAEIRRFLTIPSADATAAREVLTPLAVANQPSVELRTADGVRVLEVGPARGKAAPLDATVPLHSGLSSFHLSHDTVFYGLVAEVDEPTSATDQQHPPAGRTLGYIVVRRMLTTVQTTDTLNRLVGNGALVAVGPQAGGVWTDFSKAVPAPPIDPTRNGFLDYQAPNGERRLGAASVAAGTPWTAWIEFPRDRILAPLHAMQRRMLAMGLIVIAVSAGLVFIVSARITTPLHDLTTATSAIAAGEYTRRVRFGRDEIGRLADAFNVMTERVEAAHEQLESRVRERTAELDKFFSLSIDMLCISGTDGRFRRVNPAWEETLGWSAEQLTSMAYIDLVHPDDRGRTAAEAAGLASGATTVRFENRYRANDGSYRWLSWKAAAADGHGLIYGAARDVTEERRAAEALARHVSDLNVINDELESFSYSVSHDLRAPLRHIVGFAALLQEAANDRMLEEDRRYVQTIVKSATHMGRLIDDLLSFSRMSRAALDRRPVNLAALISEIVVDVGREARKDITWKIHSLPTVQGDRAMLRQVFVNLLSNAVKYTSSRQHPEIEVNVDGAGSDDTVIYVRDNGVGFDMNYADKLFGVFQRLHSSDQFEGTGIGLANVRRIVHRHGGKVWAEGVVDGGATFYVALPGEGTPQ
jgi:PAS domain S-box-containing protein